MATSQAPGRPAKRHQGPSRPARPALVQRQSHHAHQKAHRPTSSKGKAAASNTPAKQDHDHRFEDEMTNSFPQYCTVCEQQIVIPGSVLYCSESCRQQDSSNSPSYTIFKSDSIPPPPTEPSFGAPHPSRDIVPQMSPTLSNRHPKYPSQTSLVSLASDNDSSCQTQHRRRQRPSPSRIDSEAAHYLAQFQSSERPHSRREKSRSSGNITPLLSTTPASSTSASMPYTPEASTSSYTALPPRNPRWSMTSNRSVDLVTPITYYPTAPSSLTTVTDKMAQVSLDDESSTPTLVPSPIIDEALSYEKRKDLSPSTVTPGHGSLKKLFRFDQMRSTARSTKDYYHAEIA